MTINLNHVRKRGNFYQYERRVPKQVIMDADKFEYYFKSRALFRRSLRTDKRDEMLEAVRRIDREFDELVAQATGRAKPKDSGTMLRKLAESDLHSVIERYHDGLIRPFENAVLKADAGLRNSASPEQVRSETEIYVDAIRTAHRNGEQDYVTTFAPDGHRFIAISPFAEAASVIEREGLNIQPGTPEFGAVVRAIRTGVERSLKTIQAIEDGTVLPTPSSLRARKSEACRLTIREAVERYLEHKNLPPKTTEDVKLSLRIFEHVIGNKPLDALSRTDFIAFVEHLSRRSVGGKTAGSIKRHMSKKTMDKKIGWLRSAINFARDREWFAGSNPAEGIKTGVYAAPKDDRMRDKRGFTVGELNKVFSYSWFTGCLSPSETHVPGNYRLRGAEYWAPVMALFTGCRASELGGLRVAEVLLDDPHPHIVIQANGYRRIKNGEARRVPILNALLELGFAEYVQRIARSGAERVFPDWDRPGGEGSESALSNGKIIRAFNRTVIKAALGDVLPQDARREVTFHAFRGAFKAMLGSSRYTINPNIIHEVIGHSKSELDSRYIGTVPIEETHRAIKDCCYEGLVIPKLEQP